MSEEVRTKLEALLCGVGSSRREMLKRMLLGASAVALVSPVATLLGQEGAATGEDEPPFGEGKGKGKGKGKGQGRGKGDGSGKGKGDGSGRPSGDGPRGGKGKGRRGGE